MKQLRGKQQGWSAAGGIDPRLALFFVLVAAITIAGTVFNAGDRPGRSESRPAAQEPTAASENVSGNESLDENRAAFTPTNTSLPVEFLTNQQQTIGLTLAAAALVLVVVIGVLSAFIQNPGDS
jgi:hypothetical protein